MVTVFAREKMHILPDKSQSRTEEKHYAETQKYNMETISLLGSMIKLTVFVSFNGSNYWPMLFCFSPLECLASNYSDGGIRKNCLY